MPHPCIRAPPQLFPCPCEHCQGRRCVQYEVRSRAPPLAPALVNTLDHRTGAGHPSSTWLTRRKVEGAVVIRTECSEPVPVKPFPCSEFPRLAELSKLTSFTLFPRVTDVCAEMHALATRTLRRTKVARRNRRHNQAPEGCLFQGKPGTAKSPSK